jgi:energy-converting hydrogenase Eha subunit F
MRMPSTKIFALGGANLIVLVFLLLECLATAAVYSKTIPTLQSRLLDPFASHVFLKF